MNSYKIEQYDFDIIDNKDKSCQILFGKNDGEAFKKERRKLYVIHDQKEILYVGEANSSIKIRFQRACHAFNYYSKNNKARLGYKGYKWLNRKNCLSRKLKVTVAVFDITLDAEESRCFIEAIEGELVFIIRTTLKYWPKFQNEIHFSNMNGAKEIAEEVFKIINDCK